MILDGIKGRRRVEAVERNEDFYFIIIRFSFLGYFLGMVDVSHARRGIWYLWNDLDERRLAPPFELGKGLLQLPTD